MKTKLLLFLICIIPFFNAFTLPATNHFNKSGVANQHHTKLLYKKTPNLKDVVQPTVTIVSPQSSKDFILTQDLIFKFSKQVNNVNNATVKLIKDSNMSEINLIITKINDVMYEAKIQPGESVSTSKYTLSFKNDIVDNAGIALVPYSFKFSGILDTSTSLIPNVDPLSWNIGVAVTSDSSGNQYIISQTFGAIQNMSGLSWHGMDAIVTKVDVTGNTILWQKQIQIDNPTSISPTLINNVGTAITYDSVNNVIYAGGYTNLHESGSTYTNNSRSMFITSLNPDNGALVTPTKIIEAKSNIGDPTVILNNIKVFAGNLYCVGSIKNGAWNVSDIPSESNFTYGFITSFNLLNGITMPNWENLIIIPNGDTKINAIDVAKIDSSDQQLIAIAGSTTGYTVISSENPQRSALVGTFIKTNASADPDSSTYKQQLFGNNGGAENELYGISFDSTNPTSPALYTWGSASKGTSSSPLIDVHGKMDSIYYTFTANYSSLEMNSYNLLSPIDYNDNIIIRDADLVIKKLDSGDTALYFIGNTNSRNFNEAGAVVDNNTQYFYINKVVNGSTVNLNFYGNINTTNIVHATNYEGINDRVVVVGQTNGTLFDKTAIGINNSSIVFIGLK